MIYAFKFELDNGGYKTGCFNWTKTIEEHIYNGELDYFNSIQGEFNKYFINYWGIYIKDLMELK